MPNRKLAILYWVTTGMIALNWTYGGTSALLGVETSREVFQRLGYPGYFGLMLGTAQLLAVAALLLPVPRTLREWAYAGLAFDTVAAVISLLAIGSPWYFAAVPAFALAVVLTSYRAWRARIATGGGHAPA